MTILFCDNRSLEEWWRIMTECLSGSRHIILNENSCWNCNLRVIRPPWIFFTLWELLLIIVQLTFFWCTSSTEPSSPVSMKLCLMVVPLINIVDLCQGCWSLIMSLLWLCHLDPNSWPPWRTRWKSTIWKSTLLPPVEPFLPPLLPLRN